MTVSVPTSRPGRPARLGPVGVAAAALLAAVVLVPFPAASAWQGGGYRDLAALRDAVGSGLVRFWSTGGGQIGPDLGRAADFWARFHVVKAALAAALLAVLVVLLARAWRAAVHAADRGRRMRTALVGAVTAPLAVLALLVLVANLQGAVAPLSSVLGVLPLAAPHGELAVTVAHVRRSLATGTRTPAQDVLVHDFAVYHLSMAALGLLVMIGLLVVAVVLWRRRAAVPATDRRWRRVLAFGAVALLVLAGLFAVVAAANAGTAAHPVPALLGFFEGGQ